MKCGKKALFIAFIASFLTITGVGVSYAEVVLEKANFEETEQHEKEVRDLKVQKAQKRSIRAFTPKEGKTSLSWLADSSSALSSSTSQ